VFPFYESNRFSRHDAGGSKGGLKFLKFYIYYFEDGRYRILQWHFLSYAYSLTLVLNCFITV
jgi:hypothetical protein